MKKIFTFIFMTAIAISSYGQQFSVTRHANNGFSKTITTDREGNVIRLEEPKRMPTPVLKAAEEDAGTQKTIYVKLVCPEDMEPICVWHGSSFLGEHAYWGGEDVLSLELDSSSAWECENNVITAEFTEKNYSGNPNHRWLVIRKYDELKDGMEITFDASEACNAYSFRFLNPGGEQLIPSHYLVDVDTEERTLIEQGNMQEAVGEITIYDRVHGFDVTNDMFIIKWNSYSDGSSERKNIEPPVFYLNDLPADMAIYGQLRALEKQDEYTTSTLVMTTSNVNEPGVISNNPDNYSEVTTDFIPDASLDGDMWLGINLDFAVNGRIGWGSGTYYDMVCEPGVTVTLRTGLCLNEATMQGTDVVQALYGARLTPKYSDAGIIQQSMLQEAGRPVIRPVNKTFGAAETNTYCRTFEFWDDLNIFKIINDKLPASLDDYDYLMNNCAPLLVSLGVWPEDYGVVSPEYYDYLLDMEYFSTSYCGRAGEALSHLAQAAPVRQSVEGSVMTFAVDVNGAQIDGEILSENKATMTCNVDKIDWVPPTAQLLWFTDGQLVTDRFQTPENAVLHLYAADFRYTLNDTFDKDIMEAYPLESIKIEYAPYGSDEFVEIEVSENADMFFIPGYGYCYEGSLAGIDKASSNGWMDLRITLTDDSGNVQMQTLSPAFHVESLGGVDNILTDNIGNVGNTELYDLQGRKVGSNPVPGIYVRRTDNRTEKVVVR